MNDAYTLHKQYQFNVPDTQGDSWCFNFRVKFRQFEETIVKASWECQGLGMGEFFIQDVDITWTCLLVAWHKFANLAHETVEKWNIEEESNIKQAMVGADVIPDRKLSTGKAPRHNV